MASERDSPTDRTPPSGSANPSGSAVSEALPERSRYVRRAPPWLVSLMVHLVALLILALIATPATSELTRLLFTAGTAPREAAMAFTDMESLDVPDPVESEMEPADVFAETSLDSMIEKMEVVEQVEMIDLPEILGPEINTDTPMFGGRTGVIKQVLMDTYGATEQTQDAVELGLTWLRRYQLRDGSWSLRGPYRDGSRVENHCAATSMAVLAFLGDGHTHKEGPHAKAVDKALRFLVGRQDRSGLMAKGADDGRMYAQAQATIALCEAYGMTGDSWLKSPAQAALDFAFKAQSREGGWRYRPRQGSDTSVTGWFVMAIKSGASAGLQIDHSALRKVHDYLDSAQSYDGAAYGYQRGRAPEAPMTAEGLLCRQYLGWPLDAVELKVGCESLANRYPLDLNDPNVYYWYYATQVLHHYGGRPWEQWNEVMSVDLPKIQIVRGAEVGSWAPQSDRWGNQAGRLYQTCMSIFCLEVYYRHMPLYAGDQPPNPQ